MSYIKHSLLNQNDATIVETFLCGLNDLKGKERQSNQQSNTSIIINSFKKITALLENFNYVIHSSCLVVKL